MAWLSVWCSTQARVTVLAFILSAANADTQVSDPLRLAGESSSCNQDNLDELEAVETDEVIFVQLSSASWHHLNQVKETSEKELFNSALSRLTSNSSYVSSQIQDATIGETIRHLNNAKSLIGQLKKKYEVLPENTLSVHRIKKDNFSLSLQAGALIQVHKEQTLMSNAFGTSTSLSVKFRRRSGSQMSGGTIALLVTLITLIVIGSIGLMFPIYRALRGGKQENNGAGKALPETQRDPFLPETQRDPFLSTEPENRDGAVVEAFKEGQPLAQGSAVQPQTSSSKSIAPSLPLEQVIEEQGSEQVLPTELPSNVADQPKTSGPPTGVPGHADDQTEAEEQKTRWAKVQDEMRKNRRRLAPTTPISRKDVIAKRNGRPQKQYETIEKMGEGAFGIVERVKHKVTGQIRCMKTVSKAQAEVPIEVLETEFNNMARIDHPHVIRLFEYYEDVQNIYFIMEDCRGGDLLSAVQARFKNHEPVQEKWLAEVIQQALEGIACCHENGLIHKDLKSANLMLLDPEVHADGTVDDGVHCVIIDLGLSECFHQESPLRSFEAAGTPITMAPEVWNAAVQGDGQRGFGPKCDIYSLGCVLFRMLSSDGMPPIIPETNTVDQWLACLKAGPNWNRIDKASQDAQDLCHKMLEYDENKRPDAHTCLQHPWFQNVQTSSAQLSQQQVGALVHAVEHTDFQKKVLMRVASQLSISELKNLTNVFKQFDADKSGELDSSEFIRFLQKIGVDPETAEESTKAVDTNKDGKIQYTEFVRSCISEYTCGLRDQLWNAFTHYDVDGNGVLSRHEVALLLQSGGIPASVSTSHDVDAVLQQADPDDSGTITFVEFCKVFIPDTLPLLPT